MSYNDYTDKNPMNYIFKKYLSKQIVAHLKNFYDLNNTLLKFSPSFQTHTAYFKINLISFYFESFLLIIISRTKLNPLLSLLGCQSITRTRQWSLRGVTFWGDEGLHLFISVTKIHSRYASNLELLQKEIMILSLSSQAMWKQVI